MNRSAGFWNFIAKWYARQPVADEAAYQEKLRVTRERLRPDMEVLEFGCGTGSTAIVHAPHVKHIRAIDISSKMIDIAQGKAAAQGVENVTFERATIDEITVADASLDAVLGLNILHLLSDRDAAITEAHRMLKPGGLFVTSTPCLGDTMSWFRPIAAVGATLGLLPRVRFFTDSQLEESLTGGGFAIDYRWHPGKGKGLFIVARKTGSPLPESRDGAN